MVKVVVFICTLSTIFTFPQEVHADECDTMAFTIAAQTGATVGERIAADNSIVLLHQATSESGLGCGNLMFLTMFSNSSSPNTAFFNFVAKAGHALTGLPEMTVKKIAMQCHHGALQANSGSSIPLQVDKFIFNCSAGSNFGSKSEVEIEQSR